MILVTGGAGFIGSHVVDALLAAGEEPVVLDNFASGDRANLQKGVRLIEADVADPDVTAIVADLKPEVVVHAAAQVSVAVSMEDPALDLAINVGGTANVLAGARDAATKRFVFVSSGGGIYGEANGADETMLPQTKSYYGAHKWLAERYVEMSGLSYAIARPANVYGPRQRANLEGGVVAVFMKRLLNKQPIVVNATGRQQRDFVYVADVVHALLAMTRSSRNGMWNVGTGKATSILELLHTLEDVIVPATEVQHGPARPGDVVNSCLSVDFIGRDLGWQPKYNLSEGVTRMLQDAEAPESSLNTRTALPGTS